MTIELEISRDEFVKRLADDIYKSDLSYFKEEMDVSWAEQKEYKGIVDSNGFKIKRRRKIFGYDYRTYTLPIAYGTFKVRKENLIVKTKKCFTHLFYIVKTKKSIKY